MSLPQPSLDTYKYREVPLAALMEVEGGHVLVSPRPHNQELLQVSAVCE